MQSLPTEGTGIHEIQSYNLKFCCRPVGCEFGKCRRLSRRETGEDSQNGGSNAAGSIQTSAHGSGSIKKSAGYAVFNNMGTNLLVVSTGRGAGMAVDSGSKKETFMKMISAGAGLGVGVKDYRVIFVFQNDKSLAQFLDSGWSASGQTDAAAKAGEKGAAYSGAVEVSPGVWVYQMTKNGLALQLTLQGTKYYKDDDLNKKS